MTMSFHLPNKNSSIAWIWDSKGRTVSATPKDCTFQWPFDERVWREKAGGESMWRGKLMKAKEKFQAPNVQKLLHTEVDPFWSKNIDWHDPDMPLPSKDPEPPGCWPFHVPLDQRPWSGRCSQPCESESMRGRGVHQISLSTLDETQIDTVARVYSSANHVNPWWLLLLRSFRVKDHHTSCWHVPELKT